MQRIIGPVSGVYIATYAMPHPEGFLGYSKLCLEAPEDVWTCPALRKVVGEVAPSEDEALVHSECKALGVVALLDVLRRRHPLIPDVRLIRSSTLSRMSHPSRHAAAE